MTDQPSTRSRLEFAVGSAVEDAGRLLVALGRTQRWGWCESDTITEETNEDWVRRSIKHLRLALTNLETYMTPEQMENYQASIDLVRKGN